MVLSGISAMEMWLELTIPCKSQMRGERGSNKLYSFQNWITEQIPGINDKFLKCGEFL